MTLTATMRTLPYSTLTSLGTTPAAPEVKPTTPIGVASSSSTSTLASASAPGASEDPRSMVTFVNLIRDKESYTSLTSVFSLPTTL